MGNSKSSAGSKTDEDPVTIKVKLNGNRSERAAISTGTPDNYIKPGLVTQLGLSVFTGKTKTTSTLGFGSDSVHTCFAIVDVKLPGGTQVGGEFLIDDDDTWKSSVVLGHDFLKMFTSLILTYNGLYPTIQPRSNVETIRLNGKEADAVVHSGVPINLIDIEFAQELELPLFKEVSPIRLQLSDDTSKLAVQSCVVQLKFGENLYDSVKFLVTENLPKKLILGIDFLSQHKSVDLLYSGSLPSLKVKCDR